VLEECVNFVLSLLFLSPPASKKGAPFFSRFRFGISRSTRFMQHLEKFKWIIHSQKLGLSRWEPTEFVHQFSR
jgi:hypothetical protein